MSSNELSEIRGFHAHVYYDEATLEQARRLCEAARQRFSLSMGRMHQRPVGPHPCWSCQLAFAPESFGEIIPWLALNRDGLVVFIHPETGEVYFYNDIYSRDAKLLNALNGDVSIKLAPPA